MHQHQRRAGPARQAGFRLPLRGRVGAIDRKIMARISAIQSPALTRPCRG